MSKIKRVRETDRNLIGQATANADIAAFGIGFAETFLLSAVQFIHDGFCDGYMKSIQKHHQATT